MGQSFDPDQNRKLPPVAPPPRKVGVPGPPGASPPPPRPPSVPEMAVFRGLGAGSSPPSGSFRPLPPVSAPPPTRSRTLLPNVSPPPRKSLAEGSLGEGLKDSITRVHGASGGPLPIDTLRGGPPSGADAMDLAMTTPEGNKSRAAAAEPLDWDDEEESTHVFDSAAPPPPPSLSGRPMAPNSGPRLVRPSLPSQAGSRPSYAGGAPQSSHPMTQNPMAEPPGNETLRLDAIEQVNGHAPPPMFPSSPSVQQRNGSSNVAFPPPPPIPSITQAKPLIDPVRPLEQQGDVVRDQAYVKLPQGNPHSATELGLKRPAIANALPSSPPPAMLPSAGLSPSLAPSLAPPYTTAPPSDSRKWLLGAGGAVALLSIAALVAFVFMRRPGGIEVEVRDAAGVSVPRAEVFVDGRKVCDSTPCFVSDVETGRHSVRVLTPTDPDREPLVADVKSGEVAKLSVTIDASKGTLVVANDQPGVRLFVDGADRGVLPAKLTDLSAGKHEVKLSGERYKTWEKTIDVAAGESVDLGNPKLTVTKGRVLVSVKTEGARIELVRADDLSRPKALEGPFPRAVEVPIESGTWKLVAKKRGFPDFVAALDFSDGVAEKTIEVQLGKDEPEAAAAPPVEVGRPGPGPSEPSRPEPPPKGETAAAEEAPAASGSGTLNINSIPPSRVLLDGSPLGETPRTGVKVSAGKHTVTFIHPEHGKKSVVVTVGPGETKVASARLKSD